MCVTSVQNFVEPGTPCELTNTENTTILLVNDSHDLLAIFLRITRMSLSHEKLYYYY